MFSRRLISAGAAGKTTDIKIVFAFAPTFRRPLLRMDQHLCICRAPVQAPVVCLSRRSTGSKALQRVLCYAELHIFRFMTAISSSWRLRKWWMSVMMCSISFTELTFRYLVLEIKIVRCCDMTYYQFFLILFGK